MTTGSGENKAIIGGGRYAAFFAKYDVKAVDAWGQPFDPRLHEALGVERHPKVPPNTVVRVERKGYLRGDTLLRPAQVVVTPG